MKVIPKIILLLFLCLSFAGNALAQNTSVGFKGALGRSYFTALPGQRQAVNFRLGGFLTYSISREFGISGELNFARKGGVNGASQLIRLDYIEVPILAQYFLGEGSFRPKIIAGPYFGYLIQAKRNEQSLTNYNSEDYGVILGLGFNKSLGKKKWLYGDLRYGHGLAEILPNSGQQIRSFSINLGLSFPLELN